MKAKEETGFQYLYDQYAGALYGLILRIVSNKEYTEEIIQDVFVKVWNSIDSYNPNKGRFYTWLLNISRNTAIDYLKSKNFQNQLQNQSMPDVVYNDIQLSINEKSDYIGFEDTLANLEKDKCEIIHLAYYQGYTQNEISEKLKIPLGTVKTKMRHALIQLKDILKDFN